MHCHSIAYTGCPVLCVVAGHLAHAALCAAVPCGLASLLMEATAGYCLGKPKAPRGVCMTSGHTGCLPRGPYGSLVRGLTRPLPPPPIAGRGCSVCFCILHTMHWRAMKTCNWQLAAAGMWKAARQPCLALGPAPSVMQDSRPAAQHAPTRSPSHPRPD